MEHLEVIKSPSNPKVKYVNSLIKKSNKRREDNVYVVEGLRMVLDAPFCDIRSVFVSESLLIKESRIKELLDNCKAHDVDVVLVSDKVMKNMSDTITPQGVLAIVAQKTYEVDITKETFLLLEDIQDPGNLGTLFRTAEAAGIDEIIMSRDCVDIYNPKTIRSTMGTIYRMPHFRCIDRNEWQEVIKVLINNGITLYGGALSKSISYDKVDYTKRIGIVIGNEGNGISDETLDMINRIHIPMEGQIESLNAAMAGGIIMYEMHRQRCDMK